MVQVQKPRVTAGVAKTAMQVFLGLLVLNALIAIAAVLGATGDSEWKVVGTTLLLTAGCLTIAANAAALERNRLKHMPYVGAALSCVAFAIFIILIWVDSSGDDDVVLRATFIMLTIGLAATYASLLAIPNLSAETGNAVSAESSEASVSGAAALSGSFAMARLVGYGAAAILAALIVGAIIVEEGGPAEIYAVLCIVLATATVIVLTGAITQNRKSERTGGAATASPAASGAMVCPSCCAPLAAYVGSGAYRCDVCGLGFRLEVTSPRTQR